MRIGIAFSGGGARGLAHAGALKAIEEAGIRPDVLAGVSAGAIACVLYGAGLTPELMKEMFSKISFTDIAKISFGNGGLLSMETFKKFIVRSMGGVKTFEELRTPVYIGVTDFDHGIPTEFHEGSLVEPLMASCSIPIVFPPVKIGRTRYVDGGVLRNHPAWIIREKCDLLIGINVSPLRPPRSNSIVDVAIHTLQMMMKANQVNDMELCDISIKLPEITKYNTFNLNHTLKVFDAGYRRTRRALEEAGLWKTINS